jgi:hypothetical protein
MSLLCNTAFLTPGPQAVIGGLGDGHSRHAKGDGRNGVPSGSPQGNSRNRPHGQSTDVATDL